MTIGDTELGLVDHRPMGILEVTQTCEDILIDHILTCLREGGREGGRREGNSVRLCRNYGTYCCVPDFCIIKGADHGSTRRQKEDVLRFILVILSSQIHFPIAKGWGIS